MKEPDDFERRLQQHFPLPMEWIIGSGTAVTEADIEADAQSFLAFASAFGIAPPRGNPNEDPPAALRSS